MPDTLTYIFDPLCGWCYGSLPRLHMLAMETSIIMLPSGLFSGAHARPLDKEFAAYAWAADQHIAQLTGQIFTETYRDNVLQADNQHLDSTKATQAHTAVMLTAPTAGPKALQVIQEARYHHGLDITRQDVLITCLQEAGFHTAADMLAGNDAGLLRETDKRMAEGQNLLNAVHADGVPTLITQNNAGLPEQISSARLYPARTH